MAQPSYLISVVEYGFFWVLWAPLAYLPGGLSRAWGKGFMRLVALFSSKRSGRALAAMAQAFPSSSEKERQHWVGQVWDNVGLVLSELGQMSRMSAEEYGNFVRLEGFHHLKEAHDKKKGSYRHLLAQ